MEEWHELFVATAGAAAALAGLIIVAMSVNIETIIKMATMPSRAGATIGSLVLVVVVSVAGLIPEQSDLALGVETLIFASMALALYVDSGIRGIRLRGEASLSGAVVKGTIGVVQILPFVVGAVILCTGGDDGMYWIAGGIVAVLIGSVLNAWVLLVEILR